MQDTLDQPAADSLADEASGTDRMLAAKLWANPCWFAFRFNYIALRYNGPLYDWIRREHGLSRPEYVVLWSLALCSGAQARDIAETAGFPRNTLSRAIARVEALGLLRREADADDQRAQLLWLTEAGEALIRATMPAFVAQEQAMLDPLSAQERKTLSRLLAKVVLRAADWPRQIDPPDEEPAP